MNDVSSIEWIAIGLMGAVTFFTRVAGVGLAKWIPETFFWQRLMHHLPTTLLVAIAVPAFLSGDIAMTVAAVVTLVVAALGLNLVICMAAGMATVALLRLFIA
jgi:uncharacterized membrane protein